MTYDYPPAYLSDRPTNEVIVYVDNQVVVSSLS